jgi:hypothetical protein
MFTVPQRAREGEESYVDVGITDADASRLTDVSTITFQSRIGQMKS